MKKSILALAALLNCTLIMSQTEFDALKYVQTDISGTARYMGMAGAFGALGGDASAIKDNPAGLGVYRNSEVVATGKILIQSSSADWNNAKGTDNLTKTGLNNFSIVYALPFLKKSEDGAKGLLNCNVSLSFNRLKDFNRNLTIKSAHNSSLSSIADYIGYYTGHLTSTNLTPTTSYSPYTIDNIPWISVLAHNAGIINESVYQGQSTWTSTLAPSETVTPEYNLVEKGYIDQYALSVGGNFSNFIYFGVTANIQAINYSSVSRYSESYSDTISAGKYGNLGLTDSISTNGHGINFRIGAIICPFKTLRVGLSFLTPTVYALKDKYNTNLTYVNNSGSGSISTPGGNNNYKLSSPVDLDASVAYTFFDKATLSAEYDYSKTTGSSLMDENGKSNEYATENLRIQNSLKDIQTIKIGAEYVLNGNVTLRAGWAKSTSGNVADSIKTEPAKILRSNMRTDTECLLQNGTTYISFGFGYHKAKWFADFAFMNKTINELYYPYNSTNMANKSNAAKVTTSNNNMVFTVGYKF
jgi:hypothetical protein